MAKKFGGSEVRHGTTSGWSKHKKDFPDEDPCDACAAAKKTYDARRLESTDLQIRNRLCAKAQQRALKQLKDRHSGEYQELYLIAKYDIFNDHEYNMEADS